MIVFGMVVSTSKPTHGMNEKGIRLVHDSTSPTNGSTIFKSSNNGVRMIDLRMSSAWL